MNNTIKIENKGHTRFIAHRGLCGLEPENTNAAFIAAGNRSYFGIEADTHKTADGKFVIMHDDNTLHMSGDDIEISKATYETLRNLRLKQKDGKRGRTDLRIPSLEEYVGICKYYSKEAILELKDEFTSEDVEEICRIIEKVDYMEHTVFISFRMNNLLLIRERSNKQRVQYLVEKGIDDALIQQLADSEMGIDAFYEAFTEEILRKCRAKGVETNAWTVNDPVTARKLMDWGIDYITSNILE